MCSFYGLTIRAVSRGGIVSGFCFWSFENLSGETKQWLVGFLLGVMAALASSRDKNIKTWVKVRWHYVDLSTCAEANIELMPCLKLINFNCQLQRLQSENPQTLGVVVCLASQVTVFKVWLLGSAFHISASNQSAEMFPLCSHAWGLKNPFSTHEKNLKNVPPFCCDPNVTTSVLCLPWSVLWSVQGTGNGTSNWGRKKTSKIWPWENVEFVGWEGTTS